MLICHLQAILRLKERQVSFYQSMLGGKDALIPTLVTCGEHVFTSRPSHPRTRWRNHLVRVAAKGRMRRPNEGFGVPSAARGRLMLTAAHLGLSSLVV